METATFVQKAARRGIRFEANGAALAIFSETPLTPNQIRAIEEREAELVVWMKQGEAPEQARITQGVSPEHWEILEGLRFNGGECAARLLVALCRLSDNLHEVEQRLREGEPLGLWKRTERTDALGFLIWALLT